MKIRLMQKIGLSGLVMAIVALSHQSTMLAKTNTLSESSAIATAQSTIAQPANSSAQLLAQATVPSGTFVGEGHAVGGSARIVEEGGQRYLELDADFSTEAGPDLFVLLHKDAVLDSYSPERYVNLGQIAEFSGAQRYAIPADVSLQDFQSAVIWCRAFNVTFGSPIQATVALA